MAEIIVTVRVNPAGRGGQALSMRPEQAGRDLDHA